MFKKICEYCGKEVIGKNWRSYTGHVSTCIHNPNRSNNLEKYKYTSKPKFTLYLTCKKCGKQFSINNLTFHLIKNEQYKKYCSRKCANSRTHTEEHKQLIAQKLMGNHNGLPKTKIIIKNCEFCNKQFKTKITRNGRFCSLVCHNLHQQKDKTKFDLYRNKCKFKFNIYEHPNKFDIAKLLDKGWFRVGINPNGLSRDHKFSIKSGFENDIPPFIIKHIANCELIPQLQNAQKNIQNSISLSQLLYDIGMWEIKSYLGDATSPGEI